MRSKDMIYTKEARELLQDFFGHSYDVYSMDDMIKKLEDILETIPFKEYSVNAEYVRLNDVILHLQTASKYIHDIMQLVYDNHYNPRRREDEQPQGVKNARLQ
jgi:hypothetical protein